MQAITRQPAEPIVLPEPRVPIAVRAATHADLPFIDGLQKLHARMVGWMPTQQLEEKIARGHVMVAEEVLTTDNTESTDRESNLSVLSVPSVVKTPLGYVIGHDQYFKRDDVGIIYQMNVVPGKQRHLIGATLLKARFDRSAYGCRLFCCWCAQDIEANHFWEAMGFVPLAFRAGSRGRRRVHIFWQRRIRAGDTSTPYWFPAQTSSGSIGEDRLVLPIPPGMRWSDQMPVILPEEGGPKLRIENPRQNDKRPKGSGQPVARRSPSMVSTGGFRFAVPAALKPKTETKRRPTQGMKNDPRHVAAARELRDRWLEQVNAGEEPSAMAKYLVHRDMQQESGQLAATATALMLPRAA